ncbi:MAG TPA: DUF5808 domain-containing protein [Paludibacter sp.]|nr:DUF5808 domain-containing protein [Paludibacter sp.]
MKSSFQQNELDKMANDPDNYWLNLFYFNYRDKRFVLPKRNKLFGWTLNFAHPLSYVLILGIIAFAYILSQ